jgi:hypothetical protein
MEMIHVRGNPTTRMSAIYYCKTCNELYQEGALVPVDPYSDEEDEENDNSNHNHYTRCHINHYFFVRRGV